MGKGLMDKVKAKKPTLIEHTSANLVAEQVERLKVLFPEVVAEGKVDFEKLKAILGEIVDDRPERYSFTWAGKRDAICLLQVPSRATLKPCLEESVDWETTKRGFIALEVSHTLPVGANRCVLRIRADTQVCPYEGNEKRA